jgi:beta-glucanase (GH16 family)
MEYRGQEPFRIHGSVHGPGYSGINPVTEKYDLYNDRFDTGFHLFAIEWGVNYIEYYVDEQLYQTITPSDAAGDWVFDHPFYIILNLAVGGNYVGPPNTSTVFPQTMLIDYVRVYQ